MRQEGAAGPAATATWGVIFDGPQEEAIEGRWQGRSQGQAGEEAAEGEGPQVRDQLREILKDYIVDFYKRETAIDRIILELEAERATEAR